MDACTIIARNYRAHSRVLARSFAEHHPDGSFTTLVLDAGTDADDGLTGPFDQIVTPYEIGLSRDEVHRMAGIYSLTEFATAVKPWFLRTLLEEHETVTYLDPDIQIFAPLDDVDEQARAHGIVLTPHTLVPLPRDGKEPSETLLLRAGMFNLGFISVGQRAHAFLDWWSERLERECLVAPEIGRFVDQRWVDFVPTLFDHAILRDPGLNVAWWNLSGRTVFWDERWIVDDAPIRFFHFSGYSPESPRLLTKYAGQLPRVQLKDEPGLQALFDQYAEELRSEGYDRWKREPYGLGTTSLGIELDPKLRALFREAVRQAEEQAAPMPPDPFDASEAGALASWLLGEPTADARPLGANFAGYFRAESGIGEAARQLVRGAAEAGIPLTTYTYTNAVSRQSHGFEDTTAPDGDYDVNIVCVNADQVPVFAEHVGPTYFRDRYTIGVWFWEAPSLPESMHAAFEWVDEIWVASDYVAAAIGAATEKPVGVFPLPVDVPSAEVALPRPLDLPDSFVFLFSFDFLSVFERKNPLAVIDAFTQAFADGEGPILVIKSINGDRDRTNLERLHHAAALRKDIRIVDGYLSSDEKNALMAACDCYVSLHRSEGFGFTMAEAMGAGKPVIATAHGGNTTFMTDANSLLVPYRLVPISSDAKPYPTDGEWAEPDVDVAAHLMRRAYDHPSSLASLREQAREDILTRHSAAAAGAFVYRRLLEVCVARARERARGFDLAERVAKTAPAIVRAETLQAGAIGDEFEGRPGLGAPVRSMRRLFRRILWPFLARQHDIDRGLLEGLRELDTEFHRQGARIARLERLAERDESERLRPRRREADAGTVESALLELRSQVETMLRESANGPVTGGQQERVNALEAVVGRLDRQFESLSNELWPIPYMSEGVSLAHIPTAADASVYLGFEDIFRGSEEFIRERQRFYVPLVRDHAPVLDVGCGRGEFLDLLAEVGIHANGIDLLPEMVDHVGQKGHDVELADANEYLGKQADDSIGAVFTAQVIEHMQYEQLLAFLTLALQKLRPGGPLIAETVNPHSLPALKTFRVDLTHVSPVFPEVAMALAGLTGYTRSQILYPNGTGEPEEDRRRQGEYALIAYKR